MRVQLDLSIISSTTIGQIGQWRKARGFLI